MHDLRCEMCLCLFSLDDCGHPKLDENQEVYYIYICPCCGIELSKNENEKRKQMTTQLVLFIGGGCRMPSGARWLRKSSTFAGTGIDVLGMAHIPKAIKIDVPEYKGMTIQSVDWQFDLMSIPDEDIKDDDQFIDVSDGLWRFIKWINGLIEPEMLTNDTRLECGYRISQLATVIKASLEWDNSVKAARAAAVAALLTGLVSRKDLDARLDQLLNIALS